jgi:glucose-1-phosphate thymidylyltransferase
MDALILAAGYATRLYPLTQNKAKPLLEVAGKPMMEYVVDAMLPIPDLTNLYVVTNAKFAPAFQAWAAGYLGRQKKFKINVINDGTSDESSRLGAIGDIAFVLREQALDRDLIIVAGDNLFSVGLEGFVRFCRRRNAPVVALYDVKDLEAIKQYNNITTDPTGRVTFFEEKPARPKSTLTAIALYFYPKRTLQMIHKDLREGNNPDQPGRLIQWLYTREPVFTYVMEGLWFDIGSIESLQEADRVFAGLKK